MKLQMRDALQFKSIVEAVSSLVDEADFTLTPDGLKLRAMDPSHIAIVDLDMPKDSFEVYQCDSSVRFRISIDNFVKLLKRVETGEFMNLQYDEKEKKVILTMKSDMEREFIVPTLEPSKEELQLPKLTLPTRVRLKSAALQGLVEDTQILSTNVKISVTEDTLTMTSIGSMTTSKLTMVKDKSKALLELTTDKPAISVYNLNYMGEVINKGAKIAEEVTFNFSSNMPARIEFFMQKAGKIQYYVAPRIESE